MVHAPVVLDHVYVVPPVLFPPTIYLCPIVLSVLPVTIDCRYATNPLDSRNPIPNDEVDLYHHRPAVFFPLPLGYLLQV
jgi:hypothetical protein